MSEGNQPERFSREWQMPPERDDKGNIVIPWLSATGSVTTIAILAFLGWIAVRYGSLKSVSLFRDDVAAGATANAVIAIRDNMLIRPGDALIVIALLMIFWRLSNILSVLKSR